MREGEGTWLGHVLEHVAIELQNVAGEDVTFGKTRGIDDGRPGVYSVVYEYAQRREGIAAGELALKLLDSLLPAQLRSATDGTFDWEEERDGFIRYAQRARSGLRPPSLVRAAEERGIPWLRLNEQSLVQLGHGKYQQRIQATVTGRTPHIACGTGQRQGETSRSAARFQPAGAAVKELVRSADAMPARRLLSPDGGAQALQQQPRPRHHHQHHRQTVRFTFEAAQAFALGDQGIPRRRRPPPAGGERRTIGDHAAHAWHVLGDGRVRHWRSWSRRVKQRPAPRHRPREGADQAEARPRGRADVGTRRLHRRFDSESG